MGYELDGGFVGRSCEWDAHRIYGQIGVDWQYRVDSDRVRGESVSNAPAGRWMLMSSPQTSCQLAANRVPPMQVTVHIRPVDSELYELPEECPHPNCQGTTFKLHQECSAKLVRDPCHQRVTARRYRCLRCKRTFRVYPRGLSQAQQTDALKAFSVLLYLLGLSYEAVSLTLEALELLLHKPLYLSKSTVYRNVQAFGQEARRRRQAWLQQGHTVYVVGANVNRVQHQRVSVVVAVAVDDLTGVELSITIRDGETAETQLALLRELTELVGAEMSVSDDADVPEKPAPTSRDSHRESSAT